MILYTGTELAHTQAYIKRMAVVLGAATVCVLAALVYSRIARIRALSIGLTLAWGMALIFLWGLKLSPALSYRKFLQAIASGVPRQESGVLVALTDGDTYQEGMVFSVLRINVDAKMDPKGERQFYLESSLPRPQISMGDRITVIASGNYMTGWTQESASLR